MRVIVTVVLVLAAATGMAQDAARDVAVYVERYEDPILKEMDDRATELAEAAKAVTDEILAAYREAEKGRTEPQRQLRFDLAGLIRPEGPQAFTTTAWHFPPTPQYRTGTCWSFSATSFLESEIKRLHGREVKLSEMWGAYWEFVAKARGFIASRGESLVDHGSQTAALLNAVREHGLVPRSAYEGVLAEDGRFDHDLMVERIQAFLGWCETEGFWEEETIVAMVRRILDGTMGAPPETVEWQGRMMTPVEFRDEVCALDPDDYVSLMSTLSAPFWTRGEYRVPDNWWHDSSYVNLPLQDWYAVILRVVSSGGSLVIGGDVSEPGMNGFEDVAVVPSFDIPFEYIDQSARELRFANRTTTDDHGIHMVGHVTLDGHDWFLVKDSNRSSRHGRHEGYYLYRDDYVKLKMLTVTVPRDQVADILARVDEVGQ